MVAGDEARVLAEDEALALAEGEAPASVEEEVETVLVVGEAQDLADEAGENLRLLLHDLNNQCTSEVLGPPERVPRN